MPHPPASVNASSTLSRHAWRSRRHCRAMHTPSASPTDGSRPAARDMHAGFRLWTVTGFRLWTVTGFRLWTVTGFRLWTGMALSAMTVIRRQKLLVHPEKPVQQYRLQCV
eukprot:353118-Chlamydomonas_euryale.AAC.8